MMDRLLAYEMVCTDPGGAVWDKSKYLEFVRTNFWHVESYELKDTKVHVYGDAAVVTGLFLTNVNSKRSPQFVERSTSTWIRRHGTWQCVASQTMVISNQQKSDARHPASGAPATAPPASVPDGAGSPGRGEPRGSAAPPPPASVPDGAGGTGRGEPRGPAAASPSASVPDGSPPRQR
jgi:hypothetical protein